MLAFRKAIPCLKKSSEATVAFVQRPGAEVGIWEGRGNWLGFLKYFCSMLLEKRILLGFLGFCVGTFPMLRTSLPEVFGVVPFCVRE